MSFNYYTNNDNRTVESMLILEENYILNCQTLQRSYSSKIKPEMRAKLATWLLEVCEEQQCTDEIYSLSMNLFDRVMCCMNRVEVYHLQLLGCVCLFIASKLKANEKAKHMDAYKLIEYTDNSITLEDLLDWELLCLDKLRWDVAAIVPNDFVDIFIEQLHAEYVHLDFLMLKKHCYAFTAMCSTDFKFAQYPSSMIAAACIMTAVQGLDNFNLSQISASLSKLANIDTECLFELKHQVDDLFKLTTTTAASTQQCASSSSAQHYSEETSVDELNDLLETNRLLSEIQFEDDYDFNLDYNLQLNSYELTQEVLSNLEKSLDEQQQTPINNANVVCNTMKSNRSSKKKKRATATTTKRLTGKQDNEGSAQKKKNIISPDKKRNFSRTSSRRSSSGVSSCATSSSNGSDNLYLCNSLSSSSLASLLSSASSSATNNNTTNSTSNSKYHLMSMAYATPPQANSLPMPVFNNSTAAYQNENSQNTIRRVSNRRKCSNIIS